MERKRGEDPRSFLNFVPGPRGHEFPREGLINVPKVVLLTDSLAHDSLQTTTKSNIAVKLDGLCVCGPLPQQIGSTLPLSRTIEQAEKWTHLLWGGSMRRIQGRTRNWMRLQFVPSQCLRCLVCTWFNLGDGGGQVDSIALPPSVSTCHNHYWLSTYWRRSGENPQHSDTEYWHAKSS